MNENPTSRKSVVVHLQPSGLGADHLNRSQPFSPLPRERSVLFRRKLHLFIRLFIAGLAFIGTTYCSHATNLVANGSFELADYGWSFTGGLSIQQNTRSADGTNHIGVGSTLWQDIATEPGETYYIRFSAQQASFPSLYFGGELVTMSPPPTNAASGTWFFVEGNAPAIGASTRLEFVGMGYVDDVRVIATHEPLQILSQPQSRSAHEGVAASFSIVVDGGPPIFYQWLFNGSPIPGATNFSLLLTNLAFANAGTYSVVVSNTVGSLTSSDALLTVEALPKAPTIFAQPASEILPASYAYTLSVVALGTEPLEYQWLLNGTNLVDATNRSIVFTSMQSSNSGTYTVRVQNHIGSVLSLPAAIEVTNAPTGIDAVHVTVDNLANFRFVYDVDGVTKLNGTNFFAQVYAGPSPAILRAIGTPKPFLAGSAAGLYRCGTLAVPEITSGQTGYLQVRVWEAAVGVSYEDARARGGKFGFSPIVSQVLYTGPPPFISTPGFSLQAGFPLFSTGTLGIHSRSPGEPIEWKLIGAPGFRYLIEKRMPPQNWLPFLVVTNTTGTILFTDTNAQSASINFYRSRMLD